MKSAKSRRFGPPKKHYLQKGWHYPKTLASADWFLRTASATRKSARAAAVSLLVKSDRLHSVTRWPSLRARSRNPSCLTSCVQSGPEDYTALAVAAASVPGSAPARIEEEYLAEVDGKPVHLVIELARTDYEEMIAPFIEPFSV